MVGGPGTGINRSPDRYWTAGWAASVVQPVTRTARRIEKGGGTKADAATQRKKL